MQDVDLDDLVLEAVVVDVVVLLVGAGLFSFLQSADFSRYRTQT